MTKTEQDKLKKYIITHMKLMHNKICIELTDCDVEQESCSNFTFSLLFEYYHKAFEYCINWSTIRYELEFMSIVLQVIRPDVVLQLARYDVFEDELDTASERWDSLDDQVRDSLNKLNDELFGGQ